MFFCYAEIKKNRYVTSGSIISKLFDIINYLTATIYFTSILCVCVFDFLLLLLYVMDWIVVIGAVAQHTIYFARSRELLLND